ncbi:MAG: exodeoxyribonuclease VII large subunit [Burkholderiales bacterium]|jgi:exodeoxyribonuclease VII large subunit|nr:exodeoxyribonuclease VII large subunit [Burkholderiales bacterium]
MPEPSDFMRFREDSAAPLLSVSALARSVRDLLEHGFPLLWVAGEISNFTLARSGHLYFSLKDDAAQIRCVMFRHRAQYLDFAPREGLQVEARATVTLYEPRGDFQLNVDFMRPGGLGALYEAFLKLKTRLGREGLFDDAAKRPLPAYPRAIGVVTSPQAAALRDVLTTLARRNPSIPVVVYPAAVQGADAAAELVGALQAAGRRREVDVVLLVRGGGSIEDLWSFNDEALARAIRASPIPVVCGVGHETDFTIADFAADRRAPTPTAAAELASPSRDALVARVGGLAERLARRTQRDLETRMQLLDHLSRRLLHPGRRLDSQRRILEQLERRLAHSAGGLVDRYRWRIARLVERSRGRLPHVDALRARAADLATRDVRAMDAMLALRARNLESLTRALEHLGPQSVLERGYAIVRDASGTIVRDADPLAPGDPLEITFARGVANANVARKRPREG